MANHHQSGTGQSLDLRDVSMNFLRNTKKIGRLPYKILKLLLDIYQKNAGMKYLKT